MPELPEVETTKASLSPLLGHTVNHVQVFQPKLRWPMPADLDSLLGYQLRSVSRRAKYLILTFKPRPSPTSKPDKTNVNMAIRSTKRLLIHLGMSGSLQQHPSGSDIRKHDHLIINFLDDSGVQTQLHYHDPRRFGAVLWHDEYADKLLNHLGVEPLSETFTAEYLYNIIQRIDLAENKSTDNAKPINISGTNKRRIRPIERPIKTVIMEQQVVVGVGNIYAAESLHLAKIHPATPANVLTKAQLELLVKHIKSVLAKSIKLGGSTLKDFTVASGQTGYFQQTLHVYGRQGEACLHCGHTLDNLKLGGRASVFCPHCQPLASLPV